MAKDIDRRLNDRVGPYGKILAMMTSADCPEKRDRANIMPEIVVNVVIR